ncbi:beta-N-acetylhexosaminidase [Saccharospirillum salsuginis]|uniref:beta-N-acetylhexosaminidase n=1 Tax=Saccharospirillum salsuginis TaxID=418750 RepID=A0A918K9I5_9GAMM|nr:family 20 glycosylhydrolase [Saccharospirillum salsuginis]GGX55747.1 beta-hexosaminidase [Saccharospirillum salsuginis]
MRLTAEVSVTRGDREYEATLTIAPTETGDFKASEVCMSLVHPMDPESVSGARLVERKGDWHRLALAVPWSGDAPLVLGFRGAGRLPKVTDQPYGVYLVTPDGCVEVDVAGSARREVCQGAPVSGDGLAFVPRPQRVEVDGAPLGCPAALHFSGDAWNTDWLLRLWERFDEVEAPRLDEAGLAVREERAPALSSAFELSVRGDGIFLQHRDRAGFQAGQAYLMQYLLQWPLAGSLPACELAGEPRFGYRGVHLDVVRHFFDAGTIRGWLDVLALFQFNRFHWHLTDDDGWRVESRVYPQINETANWRGHGLALPPQMGTGPSAYGGFYTVADVRDTVERARSLGIEIVPEMDVPGHARALLKALPELVEADDRSEYRSVQHHNDNVLNPAMEATHTVINTLLDEWCELFPGPLFHLGSDEVPEGAWLESPTAKAWADRSGESPANLHGAFMADLEKAVQAHGKTPAGWEEIRTGERVSPATWVFSWQGVEAGQAAAEAGHPVVMTPAQHCYFDLAVTEDADDPGYYWAGTVDLSDVWHYNPLEGLSDEAQGRIQGVQACLWTEIVTTPGEAEFMWFPRLLGLAEVAWGSNRDGGYVEFEHRAGQWMSILAHLGIQGRARSMGW